MRAEHIDRLISVGRPSIAPDGSFAVFATSRPDLEADRAVGQLWRIELPDGSPRRLTRGTADGAPRLSPDGGTLAFVRGDAKGRPQLFVVAPNGGEPVQVTDQPLGVSEYDWSADSSRLVFTARIPEPGRYGSVEGLDASAEAPRHITGIRWHANGLGYLADRPAHVFVVEVPAVDSEPFYAPAPRVVAEGETPAKPRVVGAEPVQLTDGTDSHAGVFVMGDEVLTRVDAIEQDAAELRSTVVAVRLDGSGQREVIGLDLGLSITDAATAADGTLAVLASHVGAGGTDFVASNVALWLIGPDGARALTDAETIDLTEAHLSVAGEDFLVQDRTRGRNRLLRVSRRGDVTEVFGADAEVGGHAVAGDRIVAAASTASSFGELFVIDGGAARAVTDFGAGIAEAGIVTPVEFETVGRDGYPIHGWVATPEGEGPFPVILQIHGGPYATYGVHLFDETQVLVDAGYAVVYCNPRGSAGYGQAHGRSIRQAMGTVDLHDVLDFLDGAIAANPAFDGERVGVMGGSYGGYLTAWTIAHDHRFRGAIVERGFLDPISFQGTSDIGSFFGDEYVGTDPEQIAAQSPMAVVGQVTTPTFVIHSELDFRCPLEQATRYYSALRRQGTPAEMLVFPGENHELTRSGRPSHRAARFAAVLDWWSRYLPTD